MQKVTLITFNRTQTFKDLYVTRFIKTTSDRTIMEELETFDYEDVRTHSWS